MKNLYFIIFIKFMCLNLINAQVGINTTTVAPSVALDISATDKGVLLPKYDLLDVYTGPISNPATGLLIYNDGPTSPYSRGIYYWNGTKWDKFITNYESNSMFSLSVSGSGNPVIVSNTITETSGWQTNLNNIADATTDGSTINLPAGKYKIDVKIDAFYNTNSSAGILTMGTINYNTLALKCGIVDAASTTTFLSDVKYNAALVTSQAGSSIFGMSFSFWLDLATAKSIKLHLSFASGNTNQLATPQVNANQNGLMMNITKFQ